MAFGLFEHWGFREFILEQRKYMKLLFVRRSCENMRVSLAQQVVQMSCHKCEVGDEAPIYVASSQKRAYFRLVTVERGAAHESEVLLCIHQLPWTQDVVKIVDCLGKEFAFAQFERGSRRAQRRKDFFHLPDMIDG